MGDWNRSTREISARNLAPEMAAALQEHTSRFGLKIPLDDCEICIETVSDRTKRRLFGGGGPKRTIIDALVTPEWFVGIVRAGDSDEATAMTVRLREATVRDFKDSPIFEKIPDNGVHVNGLFTGRVGMQGSATTESFVPLGEEPVADRFKRTLMAAVERAKA